MFGSVGWGTQRYESDVDFLIIRYREDRCLHKLGVKIADYEFGMKVAVCRNLGMYFDLLGMKLRCSPRLCWESGPRKYLSTLIVYTSQLRALLL